VLADGIEDGPTHAQEARQLTRSMQGESVLNKSLTIVLPVHNAESRLRKNVRELLELASELTAKFGVLIIDDGSTDSTYEVAAELATYFPQVSVRRHRHCLGLGASIEYAQRRLRSDAVILHDGVTPIDAQQMRKLWRNWIDESHAAQPKPTKSVNMKSPTAAIDFASLHSIQASMEQVHRQAIGFQLLSGALSTTVPWNDSAPCIEARRADKVRRAGMGQIPSLPRPKFFTMLTDFALSE
jgi:cellulose synthase/poly-beta-1,6-N-acetylglucosamine synthase-like glycosyltransferase